MITIWFTLTWCTGREQRVSLGEITNSQKFSCLDQPNSVNKYFGIIWTQVFYWKYITWESLTSELHQELKWRIFHILTREDMIWTSLLFPNGTTDRFVDRITSGSQLLKKRMAHHKIYFCFPLVSIWSTCTL